VLNPAGGADVPLAAATVVPVEPASSLPAPVTVADRNRWWFVRPLLACAMPLVAAVWLIRSWSTVRGGVVALTDAHPLWLAGALAVAQLGWFAGAACQQGTVSRPLPVRRLLAAQVAGSVANHVLPAGVGVGAVKLRFLHRHGFSLRESLAAVGLDTAAGLATHVAVLAALLAGGFLPDGTGRLTARTPGSAGLAVIAAAVIGAVAVAAVVGATVPVARRWMAQVRARLGEQLRSLSATMRSPGRAALLWGGSTAIPVVHAATLWAVVHALYLPLGVGAVFTLYYVASAASALIPSPGGFGSLDAALTAAIMAAGQSAAVALAAVLGYRLVTVWLPMAPSACVLAVMVRRGHL
jgi:uncharacterized membrane protein YbhN (UPF0104 family)